jgi:2-polyprenyl-3-methyl-5-hydroxy-6-metoxy-1,4-benzoquinol methylase
MNLELEHVKSQLPLKKLQDIWEFEKDRNSMNTYDETGKYVDKVDIYLQEKINCAIELGLDNTTGKRICDIGAGVGYFPWLCDKLGHDCDFTDVNPPKFYSLAWPVLGIGKYNHLEIVGKKDFKLPRSYDIITAHRTVFDIRNYIWHLNEWMSFLTSCERYLNEDGVLFVLTNLSGQIFHRAHPDVQALFQPYRVERFRSLAFKMTKQQLKDLLCLEL